MTRDIRIASPCSAHWNLMRGDDRIRFCPECQLSVYNFSAMTRVEVETLVAAREGRLCGRFYQRPDGMMLTQNCSVGVREALRRASRLAASVFSAFLTVAPALAANPQQKQQSRLVQIRAVEQPFILLVTDPTDARIPKADITLTDESSGTRISGKTDDDGQLRLAGLPAGTYNISIVRSGFKTIQVSHVSWPKQDPFKFQMEVTSVMGEVMLMPGLDVEQSGLPNQLSESTATVVVGEVVPIDTRNPIRKFFSRLRHLF